MALTDALKVRCNYCSREKSPTRITILGNRQSICDYCLEWHFKAMDALAGAVPDACQGCGVTVQKLKDSTSAVDIRMYLVPRDGIYQVLCAPCKDGYVRKRADFYGPTKFGREVLKIA